MRPPQSRRYRLEQGARGCWPGTVEALEAVVRDSGGEAAWRPARAAAMVGQVEAPDGHVWMHPREFERWLATHFPLNTARASRIVEEIGIGLKRRREIIAGERPVSKLEALACAHYATGHEMPVTPGDVAGFEAWVSTHFGATRAVSMWLGLGDKYVLHRMRGYATERGGRVPRTPEPDIIRALDWLWRVGPVCPYGQRLPVCHFPGQGDPTP